LLLVAVGCRSSSVVVAVTGVLVLVVVACRRSCSSWWCWCLKNASYLNRGRAGIIEFEFFFVFDVFVVFFPHHSSMVGSRFQRHIPSLPSRPPSSLPPTDIHTTDIHTNRYTH
jgi:hypothetical protein